MAYATTNDRKELSLQYKHLRVSLIFMSGILLLCGSLWLTGLDPSELSERSQRRFGWTFPWLPWFLAVVSTLGAMYWGRALFDRRPQLTVGPNGIHDRRKTKTPIPWSDVEDVRIRTVATNTVIEVFLKDPERYMGQGWSAPLFALNKAFGYTQLAIGTTGLEGSDDDVVAAIIRYWHPDD